MGFFGFFCFSLFSSPHPSLWLYHPLKIHSGLFVAVYISFEIHPPPTRYTHTLLIYYLFPGFKVCTVQKITIREVPSSPPPDPPPPLSPPLSCHSRLVMGHIRVWFMLPVGPFAQMCGNVCVFLGPSCWGRTGAGWGVLSRCEKNDQTADSWSRRGTAGHGGSQKEERRSGLRDSWG